MLNKSSLSLSNTYILPVANLDLGFRLDDDKLVMHVELHVILVMTNLEQTEGVLTCYTPTCYHCEDAGDYGAVTYSESCWHFWWYNCLSLSLFYSLFDTAKHFVPELYPSTWNSSIEIITAFYSEVPVWNTSLHIVQREENTITERQSKLNYSIQV